MIAGRDRDVALATLEALKFAIDASRDWINAHDDPVDGVLDLIDKYTDPVFFKQATGR